ncbi:MAG: lipid kinase [Bacteroidetes bacterium]|nr:MAG: lipid kinase [Bacteroidota bacterium]
MQEWLVIVNPNAGKKKGEKDWKKISSLMVKYNIPFKAVFTQHLNHAVKLSRIYIRKGFKKVLIVGGDGTLNEVVNGIFLQKKFATTDITIGLIPVGTGNDWATTYGIPRDYEKAVKVIAEEKTYIQDTGKVEYMQEGKKRVRYFLNNAGVGFDAQVVEKTNAVKSQGKGNSASYFTSVLKVMFNYKSTNSTIYMDKEKMEEKIFSFSVGICPWSGNGMKQFPQALPGDGLFDITMITQVSKLKIIRKIKKLYDGSFVNLPEVKTARSAKINFLSPEPVFVEADGESLGHSPIRFDILPQSLKVVYHTLTWKEQENE